MTIPMPEPVMRIYATGGIRAITEWKDGSRDLADGDHDLITTQAEAYAEAYADARVREALEAALAEAKRVSDKYGYGYYGSEVDAVDEAADAIRALLPPTE